MARLDNISIENAQIIFRNFKGEGNEYNNPGNRNFAVLLAIDDAERLKTQGWNVKYLKPREENLDEVPQAFLPVKVKFGKIPPKIVLVTRNNQTILDEETIDQLDWAEFENIVLIIRPYEWSRNGNSGVAAYLKTGYFVIVEDQFADKYSTTTASNLSKQDDEEIPF